MVDINAIRGGSAPAMADGGKKTDSEDPKIFVD
jgi:hypothetical protein